LRHALADRDWQNAMRAQLLAQCARLARLLSAHGLAPSGGSAFFQWRRDRRAPQWHQALAERGILTRLFEQPPSLRFGLPGAEHEWRRLDDALAQIRADAPMHDHDGSDT
jgi:histidinol-phosphate/aromatic aminotransferase/cobyric acid decarboxylase-like protein